MDLQKKKDDGKKTLANRLISGKQFLKDAVKNKELQKKAAKRGLRWLLALAAGYLFGSTPMLFGCYPLGISLLCAADKDLIFLFAGCFFGALQNTLDPLPFLALYPPLLALRLHHSYKFKERDDETILSRGEPAALRITPALLGALALGLYGCIREGFTLHAFFALLFYLLSAGTLTFLLSGLFARTAYGFFYRLGLLTFCFGLVFSAGTFSLFGFSLSLTLSKFLVGVTYDKWGLRVALLICQICAIVTFVLKGSLTNSSIGLVMAVVATVMSNIALPLETVMIPLMANDLFGSASYSKVLGIFMAMNSLGLCLGSPLGELFRNLAGNHRACFWFFSVVLVFVIFGFQFVLRSAKKQKDAILAAENM